MVQLYVLYVVLYECPLRSVSEYMFATEQTLSDNINLIQMFVYSVLNICLQKRPIDRTPDLPGYKKRIRKELLMRAR